RLFRRGADYGLRELRGGMGPAGEAAYLKAADLSGDGNVDSSDAALVCDYENFALTINQVNGHTTIIE
nr:hypothetical protein [Clostridiales bacterium]